MLDLAVCVCCGVGRMGCFGIPRNGLILLSVLVVVVRDYVMWKGMKFMKVGILRLGRVYVPLCRSEELNLFSMFGLLCCVFYDENEGIG